MKTTPFLILFLLYFISSRTLAQVYEATLSAGTPITAFFLKKVTSDDQLMVQAMLTQDVKDVKGNILIASGTLIETQTLKTPASQGKGGTITVRFLFVTAVDGQKISLSGDCSVKGRNGTNLVQYNGQGIKGKPGEISEETPITNVIIAATYMIKIGKEPETIEEKEIVSISTHPPAEKLFFSSQNISNYIGKELWMEYACEYGYSIYESAYIHLTSTTTYRAEAVIQDSDWENTGTYEIKDGKILLHPKTCFESRSPSQKNCAATLGEATMELISDNQSFYYTQFIKVTSLKNNELFASFEGNCNTFMIGITGTSPVGELRKFDSIDVLILGMKPGITKVETAFRVGPGLSYEKIEFAVESEQYGDLEYDVFEFVPANSELTIIARTLKKEKVENYEDYWYLVNSGYENSEVWIHGKYVRFN